MVRRWPPCTGRGAGARLSTEAPHAPATDEPLLFLDVAGGTGDIAFRISEALRDAAARTGTSAASSKVLVCDINDSMLAVGRERATARGFDARALSLLLAIAAQPPGGGMRGCLSVPSDSCLCPSSTIARWQLVTRRWILYRGTQSTCRCVAGAAGEGVRACLSSHPCVTAPLRLQLEDNSVDAYTIAFGIRNVTRVQVSEGSVGEGYWLTPHDWDDPANLSSRPLPGCSKPCTTHTGCCALGAALCALSSGAQRHGTKRHCSPLTLGPLQPRGGPDAAAAVRPVLAERDPSDGGGRDGGPRLLPGARRGGGTGLHSLPRPPPHTLPRSIWWRAFGGSPTSASLAP